MVFILVGLALLRHLSLSIALIGLFIGFTWVIQGVLVLMESLSSTRRHARSGLSTGWGIFFGIVSLIAGIVVIASPIASVGVLTIFLGIWLIILGAIEIGGGIIMRRAVRSGTEEVSVPQQRPSEASEAAARRNAAAREGGTAREATAREEGVGHGSVGRGSAGGDSPPRNRNIPG